MSQSGAYFKPHGTCQSYQRGQCVVQLQEWCLHSAGSSSVGSRCSPSYVANFCIRFLLLPVSLALYSTIKFSAVFCEVQVLASRGRIGLFYGVPTNFDLLEYDPLPSSMKRTYHSPWRTHECCFSSWPEVLRLLSSTLLPSIMAFISTPSSRGFL